MGGCCIHVEAEDSLGELVSSLHRVGSRDKIQVLRLGSMCSDPVTYLTGPWGVYKTTHHNTMKLWSVKANWGRQD